MARSFIKGNTRKLNKLIESLKSLESVDEKAAERTVPVIKKLIEREFEYTRSPYGKKWAPLKKDTTRLSSKRIDDDLLYQTGWWRDRHLKQDGGSKKDTGRPPLAGLKDYFIVLNHKNVVHVDHKKPYAKFHQTGTRFMTDRKMLPENDISKSKTWTNKINSTVKKLVSDVLKRGAA